MSKHPGTSLAILHFVGRDAGDEIEAYHCDATQKKMRPFIVGQVKQESGTWTDSEGWKPLMPPIQVGKGWEMLPEEVWTQVESWREGLAWLDSGSQEVPSGVQLPLLTVQDLEPSAPPANIVPAEQHAISEDYRKLHNRVVEEGLYKAIPLQSYRWEIIRYLSFFVLSISFYYFATSRCRSLSRSSLSDQVLIPFTGHIFASAVFLGIFKHQLTFLAHDAGHMGVIGSYFWDRVLGVLIADFLGGLSIGWWCDVSVSQCVSIL